MRKTPPTPRVQKVWRCRGSGFRLHTHTHTECSLSIISSPSSDHQGVSVNTYSRPAMRLPFTAFLHTSVMPPAWLAPTTMTASWPANITTVWKTSVQMTAFSPPCRQDGRIHSN